MNLNLNGTDKRLRKSPTRIPNNTSGQAEVAYRKLQTIMKSTKHQLLRTTLLALAGSLVGITHAFSATVAAPLSGDVFLAFRASGGTGASTSYIVNLGQGAQFSSATPGSTVSLDAIGDIGADLVATYGAGWNTRSDLFWGVFGATDTVNPTVYASKERADSDTQTTSWAQLTQGARSAVKTEILSVASGINGYQGSDSTANSPVGALQSNSGQASSYYFQVTNGGTDFGSQSQWSSIEGDFGGGVSGTTLDLYRLRGTSPAVGYLGSFNIDNGGNLSFAAVPEPSLPLLGAVGTLLLVTGRRRVSSN